MTEVGKKGLLVNHKFHQFMSQSFNDIVQRYFDKNKYPQLNSNISSSNYYTLDKIGIPIRMNDEGRRSIFGWIRNGNDFFHYLVDQTLVDQIPNDELLEKTLALINTRHNSQFQKSSPMKKFLRLIYGEDFSKF